MKIDFACPRCGHGFSTDSTNVGRRARCKQCGELVTVPAQSTVAAIAESSSDEGMYSLKDPPPNPARMGPNVFVSARTDGEGTSKPRKRSKSVEKDFERAGEEIRGFVARHARLGRWILGISASVGLSLYLVSLLLPNGTIIAGIAFAAIGLVLMLIGYFIGAYAAFSEDFLFGFLYLFFPPYTAYFLVANWDEMWRWFIVLTAGAAILTLASVVMSAGVEKADAAKRGSGALHGVQPSNGLALVRPSVATWGA